MKKDSIAYYIDHYLKENGVMKSPLKGVYFIRADKFISRTFFSYNPCIRVLAQGKKIGYFDDQEIQYNEEEYLTLSLPVSMEHETFGTKEEPVLGLIIDINLDMLSELISETKECTDTKTMLNPSHNSIDSLQSISLDKCMRCAILRLLRCFESPEKTKVMGGHFVKEILYNVLCGKDANKLYDLVKYSHYTTAIAKALNYIHEHINQRLTIDFLAKKANMSISVFHRSFKKTMGDSPLNYIKKVRLSKAKTLIKQTNISTNIVAESVGYESVSQFSREYKQLFGTSPRGGK